MKKIILLISINILALSTSYSQTLSDSLVAHYFLDGNGNDSVGSNNGTVMGATLTSDRNSNINAAYSFNGSGDWINIGNYPDLAITGDITVSAWIKTPASWPSTYRDPMIYVRNTKYVSTIYGLNLFMNNTNSSSGRKFGFIAKTTTNSWGDDYALSTSTLQLNTWYFVVGVREGNVMKVYVNSVLEDTDVGTSSPIDYGPSPNASIGQKDSTSQHWFNGVIDDVRIYKRALSQSDIQALYNWTGINENLYNIESQIVLYPNPATNNLNISTKENRIIHKIEILDIAGKVIEVKSFKKPNENIKIGISNLSDGAYFLKVYTGENMVETSKFLKTNN